MSGCRSIGLPPYDPCEQQELILAQSAGRLSSVLGMKHVGEVMAYNVLNVRLTVETCASSSCHQPSSVCNFARAEGGELGRSWQVYDAVNDSLETAITL